MKKLIIVAVMLGLFLSGCGGMLANMNNERWLNSIDQTDIDKTKLATDHGDCSSYAAMMINIPFMDGLGVISSSYYYKRCMVKKGYKCDL
jgi:hypothetical protein